MRSNPEITLTNNSIPNIRKNSLDLLSARASARTSTSAGTSAATGTGIGISIGVGIGSIGSVGIGVRPSPVAPPKAKLPTPYSV